MYRQSQMYHREGVEISRNTMTGWARQCADLLNILVDELKRSIFASKFLHGDDTPVKVLAPEKLKLVEYGHMLEMVDLVEILPLLQ